MMDEITFKAFSDEFKKIAGLGEMAEGVGNWVKSAPNWIRSGWEKPIGLYEKETQSVPKLVNGKTVLRKVPLKNEAGEQVWKDRPKATWMGTGKVTKYLPVGDKGIYAGLTAASLPGALRQTDPQGAQRSRAERISGLAGNTLGALAGIGAANHLPMKGWGITRSIIGGIGGSILGEHLATAPFRAARRAQMPVAAPQQQAAAPVVAPQYGEPV